MRYITLCSSTREEEEKEEEEGKGRKRGKKKRTKTRFNKTTQDRMSRREKKEHRNE